MKESDKKELRNYYKLFDKPAILRRQEIKTVLWNLAEDYIFFKENVVLHTNYDDLIFYLTLEVEKALFIESTLIKKDQRQRLSSEIRDISDNDVIVYCREFPNGLTGRQFHMVAIQEDVLYDDEDKEDEEKKKRCEIIGKMFTTVNKLREEDEEYR